MVKKKAVGKTVSKKKTTKKPTRKAAAKKTGKSTKKTTAKTVKKAAAKKAAKKRSAKKTAKKSTRKTTKSSTAKKTPAGKTAARAAAKKPAAPKKSGASPAKAGQQGAKTPPPASTAAPEKSSSGRKGITIVSKRPMRKPKPKPVRRVFTAPGDRLLRPGSPVRKPLIPSGPSAAPVYHADDEPGTRPRKSPFGKRELNKFRKILLAKRKELLGDMEKIENDALRSESGELSHFPQHMADQGSDTFEQSLSLDLAAVDRKMIQEIDDALERIDKGVFGICEMTGKPINIARLNELPWARYSIEAAREIERRGGR